MRRTPTEPNRDRPYLLRLSARTLTSLNESSLRLAQFLRERPDVALADVEETLRTGRADFERRRVLVCHSHAEAIELLESNDPYRVFTHSAGSQSAPTVFMLPGGGAQYAGMAVGLYKEHSAFRGAVDRCLDVLRSRHQLDLAPLLLGDSCELHVTRELERPSRQLPAIFTIEYAIAELWSSWHIRPTALVGHSMGENTAACIAGVFSLEEALGLVCLRGDLFETLPEGGMISVSAASEEIQSLLSDDLVVALRNAPNLCVVSGPAKAIDRFANGWQVEG